MTTQAATPAAALAPMSSVLPSHPPPPPPQPVKATNAITYLSQTIRFRIDSSLPINHVIQLVGKTFELDKKVAARDYVLRTVEGDVLVGDGNFQQVVEDKEALKFVESSPALARSFVKTLCDADTNPSLLKMHLFNLQRLVKDSLFVDEFISFNGPRVVIGLIAQLSGNSLAYALQAIEGLILRDSFALDPLFVSRIVAIIANPSSPINLSRPATTILRRLVPGTTFETVLEMIQREKGFLESLENRLSSEEGGETGASLMLINALLSSASSASELLSFLSSLDSLSIRPKIQALMSPPYNPDLVAPLLDFQSHILNATLLLQRESVDPEGHLSHRALWEDIWSSTGVVGDVKEEGKWETLGLGIEEGKGRGGKRCVWRNGKLGLDCVHRFATRDRKGFSRLVNDQLSLPEDRRCPIGQASDQVLETLLSRYEKLGPSSSPSSDHALPSDATLTSGPQTPFTPLLLSLPRIHSLATAFFLRIASESSALFPTDFPRLSLVVRSQIEHVLQNESRFVVARSSAEGGGVSGSAARRGMKCWLGIEEGFEEEYRSVKERLLKEAEERDDLLANPSIRNLRQTLYYESLAFVEHQRIECMLAGSWFVIGSPLKAYTRPPGRTTSNGWLFLRLSPNRGTTLGYLTTQFRLGTKPSWEELTERFDISLIQELALSTSRSTIPPDKPDSTTTAPSILSNGRTQRSRPPFNNRPSDTASDLSFSLLAGENVSLLDIVAPDRATFSEWTDGLRILLLNDIAEREPTSTLLTSESRNTVEDLTDIGLKIKLLDLTGENVQVPHMLLPPPPPTNVDFFFSDPS